MEAATLLDFLVGEWTGEGRGEYPTIEPFVYAETVTFTATGKPFLRYEQRTADPATGAPMHTEVGYLRPVGAGRVELVLVQPTGVAELHEGTLQASDGVHRLRLATTTTATTPTAKRVDAIERDLDVTDDELSYALRMAAVGVPMTHHLDAVLHRVG